MYGGLKKKFPSESHPCFTAKQIYSFTYLLFGYYYDYYYYYHVYLLPCI